MDISSDEDDECDQSNASVLHESIKKIKFEWTTNDAVLVSNSSSSSDASPEASSSSSPPSSSHSFTEEFQDKIMSPLERLLGKSCTMSGWKQDLQSTLLKGSIHFKMSWRL